MNNSTSDYASAGWFRAAGSTGQTRGIYAQTDSTADNATAGYFHANADGGLTYGVFATNNSTSPTAAAGYFKTTGTSGATRGIEVRNASTASQASAGSFYADGTSGWTYGVYAENDSTSSQATAGYFEASGTSGSTYGIHAINQSSSGGRAGYFEALSSGYVVGIEARNISTFTNAAAGRFLAEGTTGGTYAVYGQNDSSDSTSAAVYGWAKGGVALMAQSTNGGNPIEAYGDGGGSDREFYVDNDGDVYADGSFNGGGADFAEMLPAVVGLEPGDVLAVGSDGQLVRSAGAYDSAVVGIYSTKPGFIGGSDEEMENPGKVPLAIVGIVPVKVSAENGPIQPGDLLVASSTPGHAMRCEGAEQCFGRTLGKALEPLASGTGMIEMLVMLQ